MICYTILHHAINFGLTVNVCLISLLSFLQLPSSLISVETLCYKLHDVSDRDTADFMAIPAVDTDENSYYCTRFFIVHCPRVHSLFHLLTGKQ